jgi:hypothetical protein
MHRVFKDCQHGHVSSELLGVLIAAAMLLAAYIAGQP